MKENTFDVPAYKFFVLKIIDEKRAHTYEDYKFLITNNINDIILIPFENIDGLKVQEVQSLLFTSEIVISGSSYYHVNYGEGKKIYNLGMLNWFYFYPNYLDKNRESTIDKLLEEYMEKRYILQDEDTKRLYRCFFERYQDGSYLKTKERIKKLEMQGNNK